MKLLLSFLLVLWGGLTSLPTKGASISPRCAQYKRLLTRIVQSKAGLSAPVSIYAAQMMQESGCREDARSVYARSLTQFTPDTAVWVNKLYPEDLKGMETYSPVWAITAMVLYDRKLLNMFPNAISDCDQWEFGLMSYNGGAGHIIKQRKLVESSGGDPGNSAQVKLFCSKVRSQLSCNENIRYPERILGIYTPLFIVDGWGGNMCSSVKVR